MTNGMNFMAWVPATRKGDHFVSSQPDNMAPFYTPLMKPRIRK